MGQRTVAARRVGRELFEAENEPMIAEVPKKMLEGLIVRAVNWPLNGFAGLWVEPSSLLRHTRKRIDQGDVSGAGDYLQKTLAVLAAAERITVAVPADGAMRATGKLAIMNSGWVVLLSEAGGLVTTYPAKPGFAGFEERHRRSGDRIDDYAIPDDLKTSLAHLFGRG